MHATVAVRATVPAGSVFVEGNRLGGPLVEVAPRRAVPVGALPHEDEAADDVTADPAGSAP